MPSANDRLAGKGCRCCPQTAAAANVSGRVVYWPTMIGSAPDCSEAAEWLAAQGSDVDVLAARPHYPSAAAFPEYLDGARDREVVGGCRITRVPVRERSGSGAKSRILSELSFSAAGSGDCLPPFHAFSSAGQVGMQAGRTAGGSDARHPIWPR